MWAFIHLIAFYLNTLASSFVFLWFVCVCVCQREREGEFLELFVSVFFVYFLERKGVVLCREDPGGVREIKSMIRTLNEKNVSPEKRATTERK